MWVRSLPGLVYMVNSKPGLHNETSLSQKTHTHTGVGGHPGCRKDRQLSNGIDFIGYLKEYEKTFDTASSLSETTSWMAMNMLFSVLFFRQIPGDDTEAVECSETRERLLLCKVLQVLISAHCWRSVLEQRAYLTNRRLSIRSFHHDVN